MTDPSPHNVVETNQRNNRSARANVRRSRANVAPSPVRSSPRKKQRAARQWGTSGRVQAIYQAYKCGLRIKYPGTILHINNNGSCAICYDDGDHEDKVLFKNIYPSRKNVLGPDPVK